MRIVSLKQFVYALSLFMLQACSVPSCGSIALPDSQASPPNHQPWTLLLQKHVDEKGLVDYKSFQQDRPALQAYLSSLEAQPPAPHWTEAEQLAYWINAYNAFTIELVLEHYPLESIKDIGSRIQVPFVNTPWDIKFIKPGGREYHLNNIEHNIIREEFDEPRIHFALVCAAYSCPKLRREAYTSEKLDSQLNEQAREFLENPNKNQISRRALKISKLFDWYRDDFTRQGSLIDFLNQHTDVAIAPNASLSYMEYDWRLNEQP
jgi:hypothetical protein